MRSIRDIVNCINCSLEDFFDKSFKAYGIAYPGIRGEESLPVSSGVYVGIDDIYATQVYHKINGINISKVRGTGVGRNQDDTLHTYQMSMIWYNSENKNNIPPDQLALIVNHKIPKIFHSDFFKTVRVSLTNVILNSQQVYQQEYKSDTFRLGEYESLTQINYTVETVIKTGCFEICPEDLQKCKN